MEVKYYEVDISKHTKKGKRNETSMCMLGVKEPTAEEALRFLARDVIFLYKCDHVDAVREISQEEAYSAYCMDDIEDTLPVFGVKNKEVGELKAVYTDTFGICHCGYCHGELICNDCGDMPDACPVCLKRLNWTKHENSTTGKTKG